MGNMQFAQAAPMNNGQHAVRTSCTNLEPVKTYKPWPYKSDNWVNQLKVHHKSCDNDDDDDDDGGDDDDDGGGGGSCNDDGKVKEEEEEEEDDWAGDDDVEVYDGCAFKLVKCWMERHARLSLSPTKHSPNPKRVAH